MTVDDLVNNFKLLYDLGGLALPGLEDDEIIKLLNIEQYKLISQKFGGNNLYGQKFPDTPKRIDDLRGLLKEVTLSLSQTYNTNEYLVSLSSLSDYLHTYEVRIKNDAGVYDIAEPIDIGVSQRFSSSYRNENPVLKNPKYSLSSDNSGNKIIRVYYFASGDNTIETTDGCIFTYLKKPTTLVSGNTVSDFNDDVYLELARSAVDSAISIISPNKSQISQQQLNKTE